MSVQLEYNARSMPPADVAKSFIPPEIHFVSLISRNHTLLLGPRGSGKTTLLKMLTLRALTGWTHARAAEFSSQVSFNSAFVPADIAWGKQIDALEVLDFNSHRKEAAFVIHTLRALVHAMREAAELGARGAPAHLEHLAVQITPLQEENFAKVISENLSIRPMLNSLLGVELALESKLDAINAGEVDKAYSVEAFPSKISLIISAFNGLTGNDDRRWALLFDELEIAPTAIKSFLLSGIRGFDERVLVKLAMAPYMEDVAFERTPASPQPFHDYQTIQLSYANKEDALQFSIELFANTFARLGFTVSSIPTVFQSPANETSFGRRGRKRHTIPPEFKSLAEKDDSFRKYALERRLFSPEYKFNENNFAQDIRKVLPIVVARDYYLRRFELGKVVANRSRKSHSLYTGYPSIVEITEGNPRAILTLVGPMAQDYRELVARTNSIAPISTTSQAQAIRRVELLLTSLLQVIPLDIGGFEAGKGLLDFVDQIGRGFEDRLLKRPFSADYVGTFILDESVTPAVVSAVGKALNAGAIIHVPQAEGGPDSLLRGLKGQRFRISYALASRYRLLLTLGDKVNLSKLLLEMRGVKIPETQRSLFDEGHEA
ncbi:hypothetical protein [Rhizobium sp. L245/93]|uniref:ORC-CDC6 family AAA ATPase n=1 Tax=Rhizobium sp. L245/93 TaxID=2819998 RepID=UPI001ADAACAB|nr:hypothetical protein [Rhizobium sp. L245/93]MBO9166789.1 hypothetical protein [Rhizobium sp. L245/93]